MKRIFKQNIKLQKDEIILYTVRDSSFIDKLFKKKIIYPDKNIILKDKKEWGFIKPYNWINQKCKERIPNYNQDFPFWAWEKRPHANSVKIEFKKNENFYIIKLKININQCLFSDFEKWHFVLNDWYLPFNLDDSNINNKYDNISVFENKGSKKLINEVLYSWNNIFELEKNKLKQCCFPCISLDNVLEINEYKGNQKN